MNVARIALVFSMILLASCLLAQPQPGDVYREYAWYNDVAECDRALRVGGNLDYRLTGNALPKGPKGGIQPAFEVLLDRAVKAELVVEKMLCHGGTEGLRVSINGNEALRIPDNPNILKPQSAYAHHYNAVLPVPLEYLTAGSSNRFDFEVDTAGHWWPQNLVYGMVLRIYHDPSAVDQRSRIVSPERGGKAGLRIPVSLEHPDPGKVRSVDLVGYYEDADMEGDGLYTQWHYAYHKGAIYQHVASLEGSQQEFTWDTEWLPDQEQPMKLAAFVHLKNGYSYMSEAVEDLELLRPGHSVELCKPYARPQNWFTREGEHSQRFRVRGDLSEMLEARMLFRSWSPGYFNGIYINNFLVFIREGPTYAYYAHEIPLEGHVLKPGENVLKTGLTPLYHGHMVHGAEVQWPGIMFKIKYQKK